MTEVPSSLLDLIGQVYDAALDESLWARLAEPIAATFGSPSANVFTTSPASTVMLTRTANVDAVAKEYEAYYYQRDLWVQRVLGHRLGTVVDSGDLIADVELENSEFYCDYLRRADMFYVLGSVFPVSNGEIGALGIHRPRGASSYERSDKVLVSTFLPHLRRALQIRQRLVRPPIGLQADLAALDRSQLATAVVARDGRILYANPIAERLLRLQEGIMTVGGRIATRSRQAQDRLSALVHDAVDSASGKPGHGGGSMAIDREDRAPLTLLVAPLRPAREGFGASVSAAVVFIRDPEGPSPAAVALQGLFGLTPAEAAVASGLANGRSIEEIAVGGNISLNTARTHLKNVFGKTGTNRQAQLVALVLRSVAALDLGDSLDL